MGLIKGIKKVTDRKEIQVSEEQYQYIDIWKALYKGYYEDWHSVTYQTINGKQKRKMATLGMPKVVAQEIASLVFNEKCEINISDETLSGNIKDVFKQNSFYKKFQDYLEYNFALGGFVIKPYVEDDIIKLSYVTADCFVPISWNNQGITEGVFVSEFKKGDKKYTHLEWHLWEGQTYTIRNEVYQSTGGEDLGIKVPLKNFFPDLEEEVPINGLKRSIFVYFKPNTANNVDTSSPLGISVFANALDTMKSLDIAFDSFQREFALGKKRIIVPAHMIKTVIDPESGNSHRYFDANDEVYEAFKFEQNTDEIRDISVSLRVEEHISAINALLNILAMQIGFSAGSFTFDGTGVKTATEVVSENSKTFRTKQGHETIVEAGIQELIEVIVQIAELYSIFSGPEEYEVTVTFDDSVAEDKTADAAYWTNLVRNQLASKKMAIMRIHGVPEEEALKILKEISGEQATANAEAIDLFGINKNKNKSGEK